MCTAGTLTQVHVWKFSNKYSIDQTRRTEKMKNERA